jgi:hypothetical protein
MLCWAALDAPLTPGVTLALLAAIGLHWIGRRPRPVGVVVSADGMWCLPAAGAFRLELGEGTAFSTWWVRLELVDGRTTHAVLLLRDQLEPEAWRRLQLAVREAAPPPRGAPG